MVLPPLCINLNNSLDLPALELYVKNHSAFMSFTVIHPCCSHILFTVAVIVYLCINIPLDVVLTVNDKDVFSLG